MEEEKLIVPLSFLDYKICPSCGQHRVVAINKFGKIMDQLDIYPIIKLKCLSCNREYFPRWIQINGEYKVVAGHEGHKKAFEEEVINYSDSNRRKLL